MNTSNFSVPRILIAFVSSFCLSACTPAWTKLGFDQEVFRVDSNECANAALRQFPEQWDYELVSTTETNCEKNWKEELICTSEPSSEWRSFDVNLQKRTALHEACLRTRGYFREGER